MNVAITTTEYAGPDSRKAVYQSARSGSDDIRELPRYAAPCRCVSVQLPRDKLCHEGTLRRRKKSPREPCHENDGIDRKHPVCGDDPIELCRDQQQCGGTEEIDGTGAEYDFLSAHGIRDVPAEQRDAENGRASESPISPSESAS